MAANGRKAVIYAKRDEPCGRMAIRQRMFAKIKSVFKANGWQEMVVRMHDPANLGLKISGYPLEITGKLGCSRTIKIHRAPGDSLDYQCDFESNEPDKALQVGECLKLLAEIMNSLQVDFVIKLSHCSILDGIFKLCSISNEDSKAIFSSIDKMHSPSWTVIKKQLEKVNISGDLISNVRRMVWTEIKKELTGVTGIKEESIEEINKYVKMCGRSMDKLLQSELASIPETRNALESLKLIEKHCSESEVGRAERDFSLRRDRDRYEDIIFEVHLVKPDRDSDEVCLASGGRSEDGVCVSLFVESIIDSCYRDDLPISSIFHHVVLIQRLISSRKMCIDILESQLAKSNNKEHIAKLKNNIETNRKDLPAFEKYLAEFESH